MKAILIDSVERTVRSVEVDGSLDSLYASLSSQPQYNVELVDRVVVDDNNLVWVDDEGLLKEPQHFFIWKGTERTVPLAGLGLVLGTTEDGESCDTTLTVEEVRSQIDFADIREVRARAQAGEF